MIPIFVSQAQPPSFSSELMHLDQAPCKVLRLGGDPGDVVKDVDGH